MVAQSAKNRPIRSHWRGVPTDLYLLVCDMVTFASGVPTKEEGGVDDEDAHVDDDVRRSGFR